MGQAIYTTTSDPFILGSLVSLGLVLGYQRVMSKKAKDKTNEWDSSLSVLTRPGPDRRFLIQPYTRHEAALPFPETSKTSPRKGRLGVKKEQDLPTPKSLPAMGSPQLPGQVK